MQKLKTLGIILPILLYSCCCHAIKDHSKLNPSLKPNKNPKIVVSIAPFYNLVAAITSNTQNITLLVPANVSEHGYNLKPSDINALRQADIIFWGGESIEPFLTNVINHIPKTQNIVAFTKNPKVLQLPMRNSANWQTCCQHHSHTVNNNSHQQEAATNHSANNHLNNKENNYNLIDPHIWLSLSNAKQIAQSIATTLAKYDPENAELFYANAKKLKTKIKLLSLTTKEKLMLVKHTPYLVFHDAYQYLEREHNLNAIGAIALHPESPPSAQRIQELRKLIKKRNTQCIFSEPQFPPKVVNLLVASSKIKHSTLDPLGKAEDLGPDGYIKLISDLTDNLYECLR